MPSARSLLVALLFTACGSPPAPAPIVATLEVAPVPSDAGVDPGAARPLPDDVTDAATFEAPTTACASKQAWFSHGTLALRSSSDGPPYATVRSAAAVDLSVVDSASAFVSVDTGPARVRGFVDAAALRLATRTALAFGGFFSPRPSVGALAITRVDGDHATLTAAPPREIELLNPAPDMTASVACGDLAIDDSGVVPDALLLGTTTVRTAVFPARHVISFATSATSRAVAKYTTGEEAENVSVLEEHGGRARVSWYVSTGLVVAWVASRDLRAPPKVNAQMAEIRLNLSDLRGIATIGAGALPANGSTARREDDTKPLTCTGMSRILAVRDGRRTQVGSIDPLVPFVAGGVDGLTAPLLESDSLVATRGTTLVVPARDLAACSIAASTAANDGDAPVASGQRW